MLRSQDCLFLEISKHSYLQLDQKRMLLPYLVSWLFLNESPDISCEPSRYVSQRTVYLLLQVQCTHAEVQKKKKEEHFWKMDRYWIFSDRKWYSILFLLFYENLRNLSAFSNVFFLLNTNIDILWVFNKVLRSKFVHHYWFDIFHIWYWHESYLKL